MAVWERYRLLVGVGVGGGGLCRGYGDGSLGGGDMGRQDWECLGTLDWKNPGVLEKVGGFWTSGEESIFCGPAWEGTGVLSANGGSWVV